MYIYIYNLNYLVRHGKRMYEIVNFFFLLLFTEGFLKKKKKF